MEFPTQQIGYTPVMNSGHKRAGSGQLWPEAPEKDGGIITAYCDGGSRGNPGPAGFGVYIQGAHGESIAELSEYLGKKTNNFAEYSGLLAALNFALEHGHPRLKVVSDSELVVKQIKGQYRVNSPELRPLYEEAKRRISQLDSFQIQHVLREKNRQADRLANQAMDRGMNRGQDPGRSPDPSRSPGHSTDRGMGRSPQPEGRPEPATPQSVVRGFVKGGVVHFLEGELPDGVFVRVTPERG
ncbi:MAG TPA: ribonuclease HI family protein [Silvibacterium sp.]|nr:ribonuclease HI family protein [Silvibacterium sp.]